MDGKEGRRYRHTVLQRGGSQEEMKTLEDFLGRKPSTEAFYKELGISSDADEMNDGFKDPEKETTGVPLR